MRTPISRKIFWLFLPMTTISLLFGIIVYSGLNRIQEANEQIFQLKDFQLQLKELEIWQYKIAAPHGKSTSSRLFEEEIKKTRILVNELQQIQKDIPQILQMRLEKIPFFMDNFSRVAKELSARYATDKQLPKTSNILLEKLHSKNRDLQNHLDQQHLYALNNLLGMLPKLRIKIFHGRDISILPELHKIVQEIAHLADDQEMTDLTDQFVTQLEANYLNFLGIKNRKAFLRNTSEHFFQVSDATLLAVEQRNGETRQFFLSAVIGITLLAILLNLLCWVYSTRYFNRFLAHQRQIIHAIRKHDDDFQLSWLPDDEIGDLSRTLKQVVLERRKTVERLKQSEERLRRLVANAADAIFLFNEQGRIELVNQQACTSLGYGEEELLLLSVPDIDLDFTKEAVLGVTSADTSTPWPITTTGTHLRKDGSTFPVEIRVDVMETEKGQRFVALARDVSKQAELQERLRQAMKMEAIGTLAGGIAHDFNNILTAIIGYAEFIKQEVSAESRVGQDIREVIVAGRRAAELVKQILTFSRKADKLKHPLQAHLVVKEALKMLRSTLPTTVRMEESIETDCGTILVNPTTMHQIIVNLCTNGVQAMTEQKGVLTVSLQHRELDAAEIQGHPDLSPGAYVHLSITDTGQGMEQATIGRIFEPYFTTKEMGRGTGLGLAVVHGSVQDCKGFIEVESSVGKGSTFSVYLPVMDTTALQDVVSKEKEKKTAPHGSETILVVDDEALLAEMHKKRLEKQGYKVIALSDSQEALAAFRAHPEKFDLLITDQTMPGLTGLELAKAVLEIEPSLPIIMCTGHSDTVPEEKALSLGIKKYLYKPLHGDELLDATRELLDSR
jgi:PAS domain S-box-containing protein